MARLRAVATSQALGFARGIRRAANVPRRSRSLPARSPRRGRSCRGNRSAHRAPIPTGRGRSARGSLPLHDRAQFDRSPEAGGRDPRRELDRGVEVVGLVDEVAVERFLALDERAVGRVSCPSHPDGGGRLGWLQAVARSDARCRVDRLVRGVDVLLFVLCQRRPRLGVERCGRRPLMDHQHVLHRFVLLRMFSPETNGERENRQIGAEIRYGLGVRSLNLAPAGSAAVARRP
jgi:hypothetical protein